MERERLESIQRRREELRLTLPEEPPPSDDVHVITIALRFADGRTGQRRFMDDTRVDVLFNWVDVEFEMERENVILTTMNGQQSFEFSGETTTDGGDESTLGSAGFRRMMGLRVMEKKEPSKIQGEEEEEEEDDT